MALRRALERLRSSDVLEAEIRGSLVRNGFGPETVERVVASLQRQRLLNDTRTINSLVESRTGKRAAGIQKIRAELTKRGAPEDLIEERLAEVSTESQIDSMRALLAAKCKPTGSRAKGARLLLSRGFTEDEIERVLDEFFREE